MHISELFYNIEEGVDEDSAKDINETDLINLKIKLGARKKLMRKFQKLNPMGLRLDIHFTNGDAAIISSTQYIIRNFSIH